MHRTSDSDDGFSYVELLTVMGIIGILVSVAVASYTVSTSASRRVACLSNQRVLNQGVLIYRSEKAGVIPPDLAALSPYVRWPGGQYGMCAGGGSDALDYDPLTGSVTCPNHPD
jgi:prepilin-type N-terminal cleavage/methylation domain-containing protein